MTQVIAVAHDVPVIPALALRGAPPALAKPARHHPHKAGRTADNSPALPGPADERADPTPVAPAGARPSAPRPEPAGRRERAPRAEGPDTAAPAPPQATPAPVARTPVPEVGEEAGEGTGEEIASE